MELESYIKKNVEDYYWNKDLNCAITMLKILSKIFDIKLSSQLVEAAIGLHGAGKYGAQCGLVEGALMFLGTFGKQRGLSEEEIIDNCYKFAFGFERHFGSLACRDLRPEGFKPDNPPHICEELSKQAVLFTVEYIDKTFND